MELRMPALIAFALSCSLKSTNDEMAASNAAHLAKVLKAENYPGVEG
jgi:hypothetical protein